MNSFVSFYSNQQIFRGTLQSIDFDKIKEKGYTEVDNRLNLELCKSILVILRLENKDKFVLLSDIFYIRKKVIKKLFIK